MELREAYQLLTAPFVELGAYEEAERTVLTQCATENQKALFLKLPWQHRQTFLRALVKNTFKLSGVELH